MNNAESLSGTWFSTVPRRFFNYQNWIYSFYVGFGFALSGLLHYLTWKRNSHVVNAFSKLSIDLYKATTEAALVLFIVTGMVAFLAHLLLLNRIHRNGGFLELVFWGTALNLTLAWVPWLYASSIVSTVFLFLFGMIGIVGFGLTCKLEGKLGKKRSSAPDFWKMFVNAIKACATMVALLLGAIATSILLPWRNSTAEESELLRYAFLCAYAIFGMIIFVLMPLLAKSLQTNPTEEAELEPPGPI